MIILGIDPGLTAGLAYCRINNGKVSVLELGESDWQTECDVMCMEDAIDNAFQYFFAEEAEEILFVVEDFVTSRTATSEQLLMLRMLGRLEGILYWKLKGDVAGDYFLQAPAARVGFVAEAKHMAAEWYKSNYPSARVKPHHSVDALAHVLAFWDACQRK